MKKFIAVLAVLALTMISSVAMAQVTVSGSVDIRSLSLNNTDTNKNEAGQDADRNRTTQDRFRINIDGKHDNVKGRVTFENDWEVWGTQQNSIAPANGYLGGKNVGVEARPAQSTATNKFGIREGWLDFTIPGAGPAHVKVGHQFLQLGNGWFFRSNKYGSDAWLVGRPGDTTVAFVNVKGAEGAGGTAGGTGSGPTDDTDAFVLLANQKLGDNKTVGVYWARVHDPRGRLMDALFTTTANTVNEGDMDNIGLWFNGKLGPVNLQAELDFQMGKAKSVTVNEPDVKFKGWQAVVQANMAIDPLTVNATIASGTGNDPNSTNNDVKMFVNLLDADPHYTVIYEYFSKTACGTRSTGFCNTQALNIGAGYAITKNLSINADLWMLTANEKVALNGNATASDDLGMEVDVVVKWKLYDQLTWNWQIARMMPGDAYKNSAGNVADIDAIQGILSYKF